MGAISLGRETSASLQLGRTVGGHRNSNSVDPSSQTLVCGGVHCFSLMGAIYEEGLVTALPAGQPWPGSAFNPIGSAEPLPPLSIHGNQGSYRV